MYQRKVLNLMLLFMMVFSLVFGGSSIPVSAQPMAMPMNATDESKVPHYFGPNPNWANSPFTLMDASVEITGDGSGATAAATVGANGAITGLTLTSAGNGYTSAAVAITGAGNGAFASATVAASGSVTSVRIDTPGSGYVLPTVSFSGGDGSGVLVQVGNRLADRQMVGDAMAEGRPGSGFVLIPSVLPGGVLTSFLSWNHADPGKGRTPTAGEAFSAFVLRPLNQANEFQVVYASETYTVPSLTNSAVSELVTYPAGDVAVQAGDVLAFFVPGRVGGRLSGALPVEGETITLGNAEHPLLPEMEMYSFAASVIEPSATVALTPAVATAFGSVNAVNLLTPGSGYTMPTVDFDMPDAPDGVQAQAHAEFNSVTGAITAVVIDDPGSGYSQAPNVVIRDGTIFDPIRDGGAGATASASLAITSVVLDSPGDGYVSAPTVTINDPVGTGATATALVNAGGITAITLTAGGSGYVTPGGIKKFTDNLPGLCTPPTCPTTGKYLPVAVPEAKKYNGIEADEYVIGLVQFRTSFSSSLPGTLVRGYVQLETPATASISQHFPVVNDMLDGSSQPVLKSDGTQWFGVTPPQFLGPIVSATRNKPVRIVFYNLLPNGSGGDLFLPVDTTLMGSGMGPMDMAAPVDAGSVLDEIRNPMCTDDPQALDPMGMDLCFKNNRATLHLHGGISPWISDGTTHQWITPANEMATWPQGVSVGNVPDMPACDAADDGCMAFYYTNQQSARMMFYHDHSWGITRLNVYAGEAAGYLITDDTEKKLISKGLIPGAADTIPLIIQDKTFVPQDTQLYNQYDTNNNVTSYGQDPTWDASRWGGYGSLWYHHVYMPAQNPGDPSGMSSYGRWMYGPWFWPPAANTLYGPIPNPYYDPTCNLDDPTTWQYQIDPFCEPEQIPGTPNISVGMEQFNDTPVVNGVAYPTLTLEPKTYRLRILNAANDRFFNFQWYVGDPTTASAGLNNVGQVIGATEVALNASELAAAQTDPNVFPTPDTSISLPGPEWIQIGTEGGFLPAPVVVDGQQVTTWITDPTRFDVGNVDQHSLLLAPAERADVIVDFSKFAGQTLILYNDAPAAFPARVASYDYYTGAPDLSPVGAPPILPGYGPNTRTVMQVKIAGTPAAAFNLTSLQSAFKHKADGSGVFESGQPPIIVGQSAYNSAYGTNFAASSNCNVPGSTVQVCDGFVRVNDTTAFSFNTLRSPRTNKMTLPLQPKAIHDEMNATTFDEFGRMQANLGIEAQPPNPGAQNVTLYPFVNPATELIDATNLPKVVVTYDANGLPVSDVKITPISSAADGTQIWRVTHNGVDTHPIHFHLYDVQLVNRVTWDNIIIPADATELGWKDTVRMAPLEDTIVALRPIIPQVPWELPNSIHVLSPMMPVGSTAMFNNIDPQGNPTAPIVNQLVNFGWEYLYHCHILSHEEMDMMRPVSVAIPPNKPTGLAYTLVGSGNATSLLLSWNDNSINETSFVVQRNDGSGWVDLATILSPLDQPNLHGVRSYTDTTFQQNVTYKYQVVARNTVGYGAEFPTITAKSVSDILTTTGTPPAAPTNLSGVLESGPQIRLTWTDNATNETSFIVERSVNGAAFAQIATAPALAGTGSVTFVDTTVTALATNSTYIYRVAAVNSGGNSAFATSAAITVPGIPAAPSNFTAANGPGGRNNRTVVLNWTDNSNNETGFTIQRATNAAFTANLTTVNVAANTTTSLQTGLVRNTAYYFRIRANNGAIIFSAWVNASPFPITTIP